MKNRKTIYSITILIISLVVVSGCKKQVLVNQNQNINQNKNINATPTPSLSPSSSPQETPDIDTSNWKTYRNEEYGFEVKYPEGWKVNQVTKKIIGFLPPGRKPGIEYNGDIGFFMRQRLNNESIESVYNGKNGPELFKSATDGYQPITIDGKKAYYFNDVMGLLPSDIVIIPMENWFIEIDAIDSFDVFEKLLKTLSL